MRLNFAGETGKPFAWGIYDAQGLDFTFERTMPSDSDAPNPRDFETTTGQSKAVAEFLQPKRRKATAASEAGMAWLLSLLNPAEEGLKRSIQIGRRDLDAKRMAVHLGGIRICFAKFLHLCQLFILANRTFFVFPGGLTLGQTSVVPLAAGLDSLFEQTFMSRWQKNRYAFGTRLSA